jgi:ABC-type uncharacterized transport system permease subunit
MSARFAKDLFRLKKIVLRWTRGSGAFLNPWRAKMINLSIFMIVFTGYFLGFICYLFNFETRSENLAIWGKRFVFMALVLHAIFLAALFSLIRTAAIPYFSEYLISFIVVAVSYVMELRYRAKYLLLFSLPAGFLLCALGTLSGSGDLANGLAGSAWLWLHVGLLFAGLAGFSAAFSSALMYLIQSTQLKSKHPGRAFLKLPPLESIDRIHFHALTFGVILFSLGILTGLFWASNLNELHQAWTDPKVKLSFATAALYWVLLAFRMSALRRGQKIAIGTLLVFVALAATFFSTHALSVMAPRGL